jgi:hypothetical protein
VQALVANVSVEVVEHASKDEFKTWWFAYREVRAVAGKSAQLSVHSLLGRSSDSELTSCPHLQKLGPRAAAHNSSPAVWLNDSDVS